MDSPNKKPASIFAIKVPIIKDGNHPLTQMPIKYLSTLPMPPPKKTANNIFITLILNLPRQPGP